MQRIGRCRQLFHRRLSPFQEIGKGRAQKSGAITHDKLKDFNGLVRVRSLLRERRNFVRFFRTDIVKSPHSLSKAPPISEEK